MGRFFLSAGITIAVCIAAGCGTKSAFDRGTVADGIYRNSFFGFSMEIPSEMYIMPPSKMDETADAVNRGTDAAGVGSRLLLFVSATDPADAGSAFGYNITVTAERIPAGSGIKNSSQYAAQAVKLLETSTVAGEGGVSVGHARLGGRDFVKFTTSHNGVAQDIYALYHEGYALIIVGSYADETERTAIDRILSTVRFGKE